MGPASRRARLTPRLTRRSAVVLFASLWPSIAGGCSKGSLGIALVRTSSVAKGPGAVPGNSEAASPSSAGSTASFMAASASASAVDVPSGRPSPTEAPVTNACPEDMVLVEGSYCTEVTQTCDKKRHPWQCAEFARPTVCTGKEEARRYCIDRYEFPNKKGEKPFVMQSWYDGERQCKAEHKRLCKDSEWTLACEGPERLPFPYGYVRNAELCPIDKPSPKVDEKKLFSKKHGAEEMARLDQREASGARAGCVSPFGVHDLTGNVDEWVVNETGHPYKSSLKGGNWGEYRNACRPATRGHAEGFRYYQMGFRCCGDAQAR